MRARRPFTRRDLLAAGALLGTGGLFARRGSAETSDDRELRKRLAAHAAALPEAIGTNHFPMAADALIALGRRDAALVHLRRYKGRFEKPLPRAAPIAEEWSSALGRYPRYGDWLDLLRRELARRPWRDVLQRWVPRLAPGVVGAGFHGVIRTGHAARRLTRGGTPDARAELAAGLAYWAARYLELPTRGEARDPKASFEKAFRALHHPWVHLDEPPVHYFSYDGGPRLPGPGFAPPVAKGRLSAPPTQRLTRLVAASTAYFEQMVRARRHGILLLHAVTGPASLGLLLPHIDADAGDVLVERAWQGAAGMYAAFGLPHATRPARRAPGWRNLVRRAVATQDAHVIKLTEAALRFDRMSPSHVYRSACATWLG